MTEVPPFFQLKLLVRQVRHDGGSLRYPAGSPWQIFENDKGGFPARFRDQSMRRCGSSRPRRNDLAASLVSRSLLGQKRDRGRSELDRASGRCLAFERRDVVAGAELEHPTVQFHLAVLERLRR
jgi:hypothetical protein